MTDNSWNDTIFLIVEQYFMIMSLKFVIVTDSHKQQYRISYSVNNQITYVNTANNKKKEQY
jgi:hypothetical protein